MRFKSLSGGDESWSPLELHHALTVVHLEDPDQLGSLVDTLASLYRLAGERVGGRLDYGGFDMPLDAATLESLDLAGDGPALVGTDELARLQAGVSSELHEELSARRGAQLGELEALEGKLREATREAAAAEAAVSVLDEELAAGQEGVEDLEARLEARRRRPEEIGSSLAEANEALRAARADLETAESLVGSIGASLDADGEWIRALRIGDDTGAVRARIVELDELAGRHGADPTIDPALTEWLAAIGTGDARSSDAVLGHLEEIRALEEQWEELTSAGVEGDRAVVEARDRQLEAAERLVRLEELAESGLLAERARAEIDEAHESGDPNAEHEALDRYGFDSYLDYTIVVSTRSVGDALGAVLESARTEEHEASEALEGARLAAAELRSAVGARRDELRSEIRAHTGVEPEELTEEALSSIPEVPAELASCAASMERALQSCRLEVQRRAESVESLNDELGALVDEDVLVGELDDARARVEELSRLRAAALRVRSRDDALAAELEAARDDLGDGVEELECSLGELAAPTGAIPGAVLEPMAARLASIVAAEGTDPTPLVFVEPTGGREADPDDVLWLASALSAATQVIVVSTDDGVLRWAKRLPAAEASLVRPGRREWFGRRLARRRRNSVPSERP